MIIETKDHGNVEIAQEDIILFPNGIYGFENCRRFVLLSDHQATNPFMWLQCVDSREPRFIVTDPVKIFSGYYVPAAAAAKLIPAERDEELRMLAITTVTAGAREIYVNLRCPIVINARENVAAQVILDTEEYPIRYYLRKKEA